MSPMLSWSTLPVEAVKTIFAVFHISGFKERSRSQKERILSCLNHSQTKSTPKLVTFSFVSSLFYTRGVTSHSSPSPNKLCRSPNAKKTTTSRYSSSISHVVGVWNVSESNLCYIYIVLAWNSRWRSPIGLTQSDVMTSLSHGTADWFCPVSVANELTAQYSNTWLLFAVAVCSTLQKPSTFPSSTCIDLLRGDSCMLWGLFHVYLQQQYFLHAHSSMLWMYWQ